MTRHLIRLDVCAPIRAGFLRPGRSQYPAFAPLLPHLWTGSARESPGAGALVHDLVVAILTCDAAVIGGGLVGSALCYELTRREISVVLVDRHDPGRATDAGAGILSPATSPEEDDEAPSRCYFGRIPTQETSRLSSKRSRVG